MTERLPTLPFIHSPVGKYDEHFATRQFTPCARFERDYYECATRVGKHHAAVKCRLELEDLDECTLMRKQFRRYSILQAERKKQGLAYLETPPSDSIMKEV